MNERDRTKFSNLSFRISLAEKNIFLVRKNIHVFENAFFLLFAELISSNKKEKKK